MKTSFAEVIESCLDHYTAQTWKWDDYPQYGSLVSVSDASKTIFGLVTHVQTGSIDPTRTPFAYQKTEEELQAEQPQIFEFLKTTFSVQVLGYQLKGDERILYLVPPTPSKIHSFVATCPPHVNAQFFSKTDYLHVLFAFAASVPNLDELLLVLIKQLVDCKVFDASYLDAFSQTFTLLSGNNYRRLKSLLNRVEPLLLAGNV